jgi:Flp pilus assembly protein TadD
MMDDNGNDLVDFVNYRSGGFNAPLGLMIYCSAHDPRGIPALFAKRIAVPIHPAPTLSRARILLLAGVAALALSACATTKTSLSVARPDYSSMSKTAVEGDLGVAAARYEKKPDNKDAVLYYSAALRAAKQPQQAASVLEAAMTKHPRDSQLRIEYAKALSASGRFDQALTVLDDTISPTTPDWNALLVKGAVLDQMGRNGEAREVYNQAITIAPNEASLEANLGLSYAMTNELDAAEQHLRRAVQMPGATSKIRQNLALVVGLQGRFDESRALFAAELAPDQVEANMSYVRTMLTQQNRWKVIEGEG